MNRARALAGLLLSLGAPAVAQSPPPERPAAERAAADASYQAGVDLYAEGRLSEALVLFESALRRDPGNGAARIAAERVRAELAMAGAPPHGAPAPRLEGPAPLEPSFLERLLGFVEFERTMGDARDREGQLRAMQGRIAQLLAERKISRNRGRAFAKERELHALSRRLA